MNCLLYNVVYKPLSIGLSTTREAIRVTGNVCRSANTFLFTTILFSELAELKYPHFTVYARTLFTHATTPIGNFFIQDEVDATFNIPKYWRKGEYTNLFCAACDGLSNTEALANFADYVGLINLGQIAARLGSIKLLSGLVNIGMDPFCMAASLIGKVFAIISVCNEVRSEERPMRADEKASIVFCSVVLGTKLGVIIGGVCFGWVPGVTTLALFSISRSVCLLTRAYLHNTHHGRNRI